MTGTEAARRAGRRYGGGRHRPAGRGERQRTLRYPDMFTEGGEVHPIRNSPGYDELEERAHSRAREGRQAHERQREAYEAGTRAQDAARGYRELQGAILSEGGIRANRDYSPRVIPKDVYRPGGKPADEMAQVLEAQGYHYDGDTDLMADLKRRRARLERLGLLARSN